MKKKSALLLTLGVFISTSAFAGNIVIETPTGGWRNSEGELSKYTQVVNYPASSVNVQEGQSTSALIKGKVTNSKKETQSGVYKLVINGVDMPLKVENSTFARPYAFTSGSNVLSVASPNGKDVTKVQFYEANALKTQPRIRVVLSWDSDGTDLDLHVISPDGQHCFYGDRVMSNGGALDVDVTTGYGPEIFASPAPVPGTYLVYVNYYGGAGSFDEPVYSDEDEGAPVPPSAQTTDRTNEPPLLTVAQATIVFNENTPDEKLQTFTIPMRNAGELNLVGSFVYP